MPFAADSAYCATGVLLTGWRGQFIAVDLDIEPSLRSAESTRSEIQIDGEYAIGDRITGLGNRRSDLTAATRCIPQREYQIMAAAGRGTVLLQMTLKGEGGRLRRSGRVGQRQQRNQSE